MLVLAPCTILMYHYYSHTLYRSSLTGLPAFIRYFVCTVVYALGNTADYFGCSTRLRPGHHMLVQSERNDNYPLTGHVLIVLYLYIRGSSILHPPSLAAESRKKKHLIAWLGKHARFHWLKCQPSRKSETSCDGQQMPVMIVVGKKANPPLKLSKRTFSQIPRVIESPCKSQAIKQNASEHQTGHVPSRVDKAPKVR